jgi:glycosyltransferase involved in cell wall biosynthesis
MPVYNEERLLPVSLSNISPFVDEIVIIDGGPDGPSTDGTAEVIREFSQPIVYKTGTFRMATGGWDAGLQRNTAVANSTGDVLLFASADMVFHNLGLLRRIIDEETAGKIFFCSTLEFWLDKENLRLYSADGNTPLSVPAPILEVAAVDRSLQPSFDENGKLMLAGALSEHRCEVPQTFKFHMGWVRPFAQQVAKHLRHVRQGHWGEHGDKLLARGEKAMEAWAITHVLSYPQIFSIRYGGQLPEELDGLEVNYNTGYKEVLDNYEKKYGVSVFRGARLTMGWEHDDSVS